MSSASSSMRVCRSSIDSNTTARPVCCSSSGDAADGLMTAPSGARLPRSTAMPASRLNGCVERGDDLAVPARRVLHVLPERLAVRPSAHPCAAGRARRARAAPPAGRRRSRNPPSGTCPTASGRPGSATSRPSRSKSSSVESTPTRPRDREQMHHGVGRAADGRERADRVLERGARQDLRQHEVLAAPSPRCAAPPCGRAVLRRASAAGIAALPGQADAQRLDHRGHGRGGAHRHAVAGERFIAGLGFVEFVRA